MFLEITVGEDSHAERSLARTPASVRLGRLGSLDFSPPSVEFLPALAPFLPRFSAHACLPGSN